MDTPKIFSVRLGTGLGGGTVPLGAKACSKGQPMLFGDDLTFQGLGEAGNRDERLRDALLAGYLVAVTAENQPLHRRSELPEASLLRRLPCRGSEQTPHLHQVGRELLRIAR